MKARPLSSEAHGCCHRSAAETRHTTSCILSCLAASSAPQLAHCSTSLAESQQLPVQPAASMLQLVHLRICLRQGHHLRQHLGHPQVLHLIPLLLHL